MVWAEGFIAVDWGTTNRRAYLLEASGALRQEMDDGRGVLSVPVGGFQGAVEEIRSRLGRRPLLMAGMIGSNRGWVEAPYVPVPAGLDELAEGLVWAEPGGAAIVPGVCQEGAAADVMRGEEVQLLGAVGAGLVSPDCLVCHPGTHNKWARLEDGRIASFRTIMTGELFSLLSKHSILADLLSQEAAADEDFEAGVAHGYRNDDLTAELFSVRARVLLGHAKPAGAASYVSGLLIGTDLRIALRMAPEGEVVVMGRPELTGLFAAALRLVGRIAREVDGEQAFLAGARQLAERVQ